MSCINTKGVIAKCESLGTFKYVLLFNKKDWIYENEMPVRLKRKYGKFDRKNAIEKINYES